MRPFLIAQLRQPRWIAAFFLIVGAVLATFPFFRAVEYPLSLALCVVAAWVAPFWAAVSLKADGSIWTQLLRIAGWAAWSVALAVLPAAVWSAFSCVCEPIYGMLFMVLGPWATFLVGGVLGLLLRRWSVGGWRFGAVVAGVVLGNWGLVLLELLWGPGVRFYGTFFGLYHGAIYDESVFVESAYLWLRVKDLLLVLAACGFEWGRERPGCQRWAYSVPAALTIALLGLSPYLGFVSSSIPLESALSGKRELDGITIRYTPDGRALRTLDWLSDEAAYRRARVMELYDLAPEETPSVTVYLYESPWQKERLMGGGRTSIAKPWRREIHIHSHDVPNSLVGHELTHALLANLANSPLGIPVHWGVIPQAGVMEGAAVAVERGNGLYTTHQWARAVRDLSLRPPLSMLMDGAQFWRFPGRIAYNACGSFVRFLLDRYGPEPYKAVYGGASWEETYDKSLEALESEWDRFLDTLPEDPKAKALAMFYFDRKAVFQRQCPYAGGRAFKRALYAAARGEKSVLRHEVQSALRMTDGDPPLTLSLLNLLLMTEELDLAQETWQQAYLRPTDCPTVEGPEVMVDCHLPGVLKGMALMRWGDLLWLVGEHRKAREVYDALRRMDPTFYFRRLTAWRWRLCENPVTPQGIRQLATGLWFRRKDATRFETLWKQKDALNWSARFLLIQRALKRPEWLESGLNALDEADSPDALPSEIRTQFQLSAAMGYYFANQYDRAREVLGELDTASLRKVELESMGDLADRIRWRQEGKPVHRENP